MTVESRLASQSRILLSTCRRCQALACSSLGPAQGKQARPLGTWTETRSTVNDPHGRFVAAERLTSLPGTLESRGVHLNERLPLLKFHVAAQARSRIKSPVSNALLKPHQSLDSISSRQQRSLYSTKHSSPPLNTPNPDSIQNTAPAPHCVIVDTPDTLDACLSDISTCPDLYVDLEGNNLSSVGTLDLLTILPAHRQTAYVISVHKLGAAVFTQPCRTNNKHISLKDVLQTTDFKKRFWDVRMDASALFAIHDIRMRNVFDLQLLEIATRDPVDLFIERDRLYGLTRAVERHSALSDSEKNEWRSIKLKGEKLWNPKLGGNFKVWQTDTLTKHILDYCVCDVQYLPILEQQYLARHDWKDVGGLLDDIHAASAARVTDAEMDKRKQGRMDLSPWTVEQLAKFRPPAVVVNP